MRCEVVEKPEALTVCLLAGSSAGRNSDTHMAHNPLQRDDGPQS